MTLYKIKMDKEKRGIIVFQITEEEIEKIGERIAKDLWERMTAPAIDPIRHYTRQECCAILRCSLPTFHGLVNRGLIRITKVGRKTLVDAAEFDKLVASGELAKYKHHSMKKEGGVSYGR